MKLKSIIGEGVQGLDVSLTVLELQELAGLRQELSEMQSEYERNPGFKRVKVTEESAGIIGNAIAFLGMLVADTPSRTDVCKELYGDPDEKKEMPEKTKSID